MESSKCSLLAENAFIWRPSATRTTRDHTARRSLARSLFFHSLAATTDRRVRRVIPFTRGTLKFGCSEMASGRPVGRSGSYRPGRVVSLSGRLCTFRTSEFKSLNRYGNRQSCIRIRIQALYIELRHIFRSTYHVPSFRPSLPLFYLSPSPCALAYTNERHRTATWPADR